MDKFVNYVCFEILNPIGKCELFPAPALALHHRLLDRAGQRDAEQIAVSAWG
jgi:hypothetical protein